MASAIGKWNGRTMGKNTRTSNGQGHTYKVGNSYKTVIRHKGVVVTAMAPTAQLSRAKAKEKVEELPVNGYEPKRVKLSVGDFLHQWLESEHKAHIAQTTNLRYQGLLKNHITPKLGKYSLQELNPSLVNWLLQEMSKEGLGARSLQQTRSFLSVAMKSAEDKGLIQNNPIAKVRNPKYRPSEINPLSLEEVRRLLKTYEGTYMGARLHIALVCGLRQGEALGLRWEDVDLANGLLHIHVQIQSIAGRKSFATLKTQRSRRTIALTHETIRALHKQSEIVIGMRSAAGEGWREWGLVFPSRDGIPLVVKTDYKQWQKALQLCGIAPKRLHDARHTAATLMYSSGVGIETISRSLGHSTSAITSRLYVHSAEEPLRQAANSLQSVLE
jgi:integrase